MKEKDGGREEGREMQTQEEEVGKTAVKRGGWKESEGGRERLA